MLKLSNTVGTVNYLHKITKESDKNNNQLRKHKKHCSHHRNTMTAEMLLDIGAIPVVPEVTDDEALMDMDCSRLAPLSSDEEEDQTAPQDQQNIQQQTNQKLPPAILSAAILDLRNTLMYYPLVRFFLLSQSFVYFKPLLIVYLNQNTSRLQFISLNIYANL